ncbi:MAG: thioredoxin [Bacilli bacterium]|jgi:thioredoxin 1|nr:thioredoxin [Bacilli bacterium]NLN80555.1 thioredoxin [Erysipelotrichia bacterium]
MVIKITSVEQFDELINKNKVLVDFYADWCPPCRMIAPILEDVAKEVNNGVVIAKVDVDAHGSIAGRYNIFSIPTMILFEKGKEVRKQVGILPKDRLIAFIG